jgi:hypothetical protein
MTLIPPDLARAAVQAQLASEANIVRGQRVEIPWDPVSGILQTGRNRAQVLFRAEDRNTPYWQVVLGPIFRLAVGPMLEGLPQTATGNLVARMTWGGGGTNFRTEFQYPPRGTSFVVAGDNVMLDVFALDGVTVFTEATRPAVGAWVQGKAAPTTLQPLIHDGLGDAPFVGPTRVGPFARAIHIYPSNTGVTLTVTFAGPTGTTTLRILPTGHVRVPIPTLATTWTVLVSAGTVAVAEELVFS